MSTRTSERKFYRTVVEVEILSDSPYDVPFSLEALEYDITFGDCSGAVNTKVLNQVVSPQRMAKLLQDQASDPDFFGLDENGKDLTEEEE